VIFLTTSFFAIALYVVLKITINYFGTSQGTNKDQKPKPNQGISVESSSENHQGHTGSELCSHSSVPEAASILGIIASLLGASIS
jgi:hypothetical protein